uniref:Fumarylacetoacetase-like C-terminal domain-containing protein n=1 Tax=Bionectria ochroleuca TaxID=29856 RepID=A0A8H7K295_BIOOC
MTLPRFSRLVRFVPRSDSAKILIGQPVSQHIDVGLALYQGADVQAEVFSGTSVLTPGEATGNVETISRVLSPLASSEVGTFRCIGLNYKQHAEEVKLDVPTVPTVFLRSMAAPTVLPKLSQIDDCADYEAELAVIIGKSAKNVTEAEAMEYVLGYTAANDISSRTSQFNTSQWCFSKGFDGSCPLGPTIVSKSLIPDPSQLHIRGLKNGKVLQDCGLDDLIFSIPKIVSFLSQSSTLPAGTVIITGTPAGVGAGKNPKVTLKQGDTYLVELQPFIGTLVNVFENEA